VSLAVKFKYFEEIGLKSFHISLDMHMKVQLLEFAKSKMFTLCDIAATSSNWTEVYVPYLKGGLLSLRESGMTMVCPFLFSKF